MALVTRATLKGYFETGDVPTQAQFIDLIDSCGPKNFGCLYVSTPATTGLSAATPAKAAGTTTEIGTARGLTVAATNRITVDAGEATGWYQVTVNGSLTKAAGGSTLGGFRIAKNGTVITGSAIDRTLANTSDEGASGCSVAVQLAATDYVEVFLESNNGDDLDWESGQMMVAEL